MSLKLEDVKGLGKKTVKTLQDAGIDSVEKLANSTVESLSELDGIGKATAQKYISGANDLIGMQKEEPDEADADKVKIEEEKKGIEEELEEDFQKEKEKREKLEGKPIEEGDFILVKVTGKTKRGQVFRVSSVEDAKKAGIYDEKEEQQGRYTPEFVVVGKPGFLNEGLMEVVENMNYFEKKSVRIPPRKAFGRRDPQKIERIGINKFRKLNDGRYPELGQEFVKKSKQGGDQRGRVIRVAQGRVTVDYNHPLAGEEVDYNVEILDKIEDFNEKIKQFMISKGIPEENITEFDINYVEDDKTLEVTIPKMFLFQNLTYFKFGFAMDLQNYMADQIDDVKFIEVYEKMEAPQAPAESVQQKVKQFNEEQEAELQESEVEPEIKPEE